MQQHRLAQQLQKLLGSVGLHAFAHATGEEDDGDAFDCRLICCRVGGGWVVGEGEEDVLGIHIYLRSIWQGRRGEEIKGDTHFLE